MSKLPVSDLPVSLPQACSSRTSITFHRLPLSTCVIPSTNSVGRNLMVTQQLQPPPPSTIPKPKHPAKVPGIPNQSVTSLKRLPPEPRVIHHRKLDRSGSLVLVLTWTIIPNGQMAEIERYEIIAYKEVQSEPPTVDVWTKVGYVWALPLPMECTLSYLIRGERYHYAVRAVDINNQVGPFCEPKTVLWI